MGVLEFCLCWKQLDGGGNTDRGGPVSLAMFWA